MTSVPDIQWTDTGIIAPAESAILTGVQTDQNAAFGGGMNLAPEAPQGQLAASLTAIIGDKNDAIMNLANQVDPAFSSGRMQDALGRIYFQTRKPATSTVTPAICAGLSGTPIPVGAQAVAQDGNIYSCTQAGVIAPNGTVTLNFAALVPGPIACPAGFLSEIYQAIPGWESVTNALAGIPGTLVENRVDFEFRRTNSVSIGGNNSLQSIYANVFALSGVNDVFATENDLGVPATIGGVTLAKNSIYVCVAPGSATNAQIANAIWQKKAGGSTMNGNTSAVVTDTSYSPPQPTYTITWQTAVPTPIFMAIAIANNANLPSDIVTQVQNAIAGNAALGIAGAFAGGDNGPRARIGGTLFAGRFYNPVNTLSPFVGILDFFIGTAANPTTPSCTLTIAQEPTISAANIAVTLI